ncbi:MAG: two-component sensor histidine kinase [Bacteroidetes bacterium]|jgi:signal transduction histidine kinase|nr:two-component sensor histidine kinase [Bacteroidota bacterium]
MKPIKIFYLLVVYVVLQLSWWSYLLVDLNKDYYETKINQVQLQEQNDVTISEITNLKKKLKEKYLMVAGEGIVFLSLLGLGIYQARKAYMKEFQVAQQQKNFMMSITHEFKSPIAGIRLSVETLLKREMEREKQITVLTRALNETDRINFLVENILTATRIEAANLELHLTDIDLSKTVTDCIQVLKTSEGKHPISGTIDPDIHISADKNAIISLLMNLVENAEKYTPEQTPIDIKLSRINNDIFLQVCDQGPGIPDSEKRKIFEKFYRIGNEETRSSKGTGLGLYICRFITLKHKATIAVKDNYPQGSIFEIKFPLNV